MAEQKQKFEVIQPDLEINEHLEYHEKGWIVQTVGLIFIFLMILSGALGLFGNGILSKVEIGKTNSRLEFDRFFRFEARMELQVKLAGTNQSGIVSFPNEYLTNFRIETIVPEPEGNSVHGNAVHYKFNTSDDANIIFYLVPRKIGAVNGEIKLNEDTYSVHHFIFP